MGIGNEYRDLIFKRTNLTSDNLECPREKSFMTPCVARDGDLAMTDDESCVGCGCSIKELLEKEKKLKKK